MRRAFSVACLVVSVVCVFTGCNSNADTGPGAASHDAVAASPQPRSTTAVQSSGTESQYRAVCIEARAHGGSEYVLTSWLAVKAKADELANYHSEFKYKGHRTRIDTRAKPVPASPE